MLSSDPCICLVHPSKRPVGVCHLCLRDRLVRLSMSGESSSSQTLAPSSSRSSIDSSSWSKQDESSNSKGVGKVGTIFSLIESDSEDATAAAGAEPSSIPSWLPRSKSLSQWSSSTQLPRRSSSTSTKEGVFARFPDSRNGQMPLHRASAAAVAEQDPEKDHGHTVSLSKSKSGKQNGFPQSPLVQEKVSPSSTPVVQHLDRDHKQHRSSSGFSWISSLFGLRKRKKKSVQAEPTETNFFPPEGWNDVVSREAVPERERLWRSRSVSSGRTIKKCSVGDLKPYMATEVVASSPAHRPHQFEPSTVSSLIALDVRERLPVVATSSPAATVARKMLPRSCHNKVDNVLYDVDETEPACGSVATLMDIDRKWACGSPVLQRSSSTGKWRRRLMGESPSSVVMANPMAGGSEWSFYLTPLRTFRSRSSRHAR